VQIVSREENVMGHAHKRVVIDAMISAAVVIAGLVTAQSPTGTGGGHD